MTTQQVSRDDSEFEGLVREVRELRLRRDKADARLLLRLVEIEREKLDLIRSAGCQSFAQFLKSYAITDPARFENFKAGLKKIKSEEVALEIGSEAVIVAAQLTNGVKKYVEAIEAWRDDEKHAGTLPSQETAKHILMQVDPREEEPEAVRRKSELTRLRDENAKLRAENTKLRARVDALEARLKRS